MFKYEYVLVVAYYLLFVATYPAFLSVLGGMGLMMGGIFTGFSMKYRYKYRFKILSTKKYVGIYSTKLYQYCENC